MPKKDVRGGIQQAEAGCSLHTTRGAGESRVRRVRAGEGNGLGKKGSFGIPENAGW